MKVYLDNNILISIEDGQIDINDLRSFFGGDVQFVYSYCHLLELLASNDRFESLHKKRMETIRFVTEIRHISPDIDNDGQFIFERKDPEFLLNIILANSIVFEQMKVNARMIEFDRERIIKELSIDKKRLNNYSEDEVISRLDESLSNRIGLGLVPLVDLTGQRLHEQICTIFNFLDHVGFWADVYTKKSSIARVYDSSHAYFASGCDYFISNDRKARMKSKVAYKFKNLHNTIVCGWDVKQKKPVC
jgi:hypothetical protein